jgi:hypothetical protein
VRVGSHLWSQGFPAKKFANRSGQRSSSTGRIAVRPGLCDVKPADRSPQLVPPHDPLGSRTITSHLRESNAFAMIVLGIGVAHARAVRSGCRSIFKRGRSRFLDHHALVFDFWAAIHDNFDPEAKAAFPPQPRFQFSDGYLTLNCPKEKAAPLTDWLIAPPGLRRDAGLCFHGGTPAL